MPGTKYRLDERIGAGGMAEIFRAGVVGTQDFERTVAIKRVLPEAAANQRYAKMLADEARIMAGLHHSNIVAVSDFARDDEGCLFLVMELVEGVDLRKLVRTGPVPPPVAIYIAGELLRGLGYMHDRVDAGGKLLELVHGDVSAGNVLLSWDGAVKISDFGLARACAGSGAGGAAVRGTPCYMSPEQLQGGTLDRRADLYAVGVILYELLTGRVPFAGASQGAIFAAVLQQRVEPPRDLRPEIPAALEVLTMHLLERDRARRPERAAAALDGLDRCAGASPRGRQQLEALLRERFPGQDARGESVPGAPRVTGQISAREQAPRVVVVPDAPAKAANVAVHQAAPAHRRTVTVLRGRGHGGGRGRWAWAWVAALLLGSVIGSLLLDGDTNFAPRTDVTQGPACTLATSVPMAAADMDAPRANDETDAPAVIEPGPAAEPSSGPASASSGRRSGRAEILPSRPDDLSTVDFFVKKAPQ